MPIAPAQAAQAEQQQWQAARDVAPQVRLVAGPGTGKSATVERRVAHLLNSGVVADNVYVISFTRATCNELETRIAAFCAEQPCAALAANIHLSTMHSLALSILRGAAVLNTLYPADPFVLDDWERENVYDIELANVLGCARGRAEQIRLAHDAQWQTLNPQMVAQPPITPAEQHNFMVFHTTRRNLYSCVLPGEVIYECVTRIQQGAIHAHQLPRIEHLIVDEYQDLNACDQEFIRLLVANGAILFVAGDDDQSIYSFRHANPSGIVHFSTPYPAATTHILNACFRCTPAILTPAIQMIVLNPDRQQKRLQSLYATATPPVQGVLHIWSFPTAAAEAQAIAESAERLIVDGLAGQEDQIVILISNRRLQLPLIVQELGNRGLPFDPPGGTAVRDTPGVRAGYSILRIVRDLSLGQPDYVAHRALLGQLHGVGANTARAVGELCVTNLQNFRDLFHAAAVPHWLTGLASGAVTRIRSVLAQISAWTLDDTIGTRGPEVAALLTERVFGGAQAATNLDAWAGFTAGLPDDMTLGEVLEFLAADDEARQRQVLDAVAVRLGRDVEQPAVPARRIRILTMHGAKGLSGKVVFIPSAEQGIMPSFRAIHAAGLLAEQRRLFYVSVTRAKACCIISHAALHTGAQAFLIRQQSQVMLPRSQFLGEMGGISVNRQAGLTASEAAVMLANVNAL